MPSEKGLMGLLLDRTISDSEEYTPISQAEGSNTSHHINEIQCEHHSCIKVSPERISSL